VLHSLTIGLKHVAHMAHARLGDIVYGSWGLRHTGTKCVLLVVTVLLVHLVSVTTVLVSPLRRCLTTHGYTVKHVIFCCVLILQFWN